MKTMTNRQKHLLVIMMEECGEIVQGASKILRFGHNSYHPGSNETNEEHVLKEINDLLAVIEMTVGVPIEEVIDRELMAEKKERVEKYLEVSKQLNLLP